VLDDDHRMAAVNQGVQAVDQTEHVEGMKDGGGLVEDEDRGRCCQRGSRAAQEARQLKPLSLATRC
jgi:hypothetical protein